MVPRGGGAGRAGRVRVPGVCISDGTCRWLCAAGAARNRQTDKVTNSTGDHLGPTNRHEAAAAVLCARNPSPAIKLWHARLSSGGGGKNPAEPNSDAPSRSCCGWWTAETPPAIPRATLALGARGSCRHPRLANSRVSSSFLDIHAPASHSTRGTKKSRKNTVLVGRGTAAASRCRVGCGAGRVPRSRLQTVHGDGGRRGSSGCRTPVRLSSVITPTHRRPHPSTAVSRGSCPDVVNDSKLRRNKSRKKAKKTAE